MNLDEEAMMAKDVKTISNLDKLNLKKEQLRRQKQEMFKNNFAKFSEAEIKIITKDSALGFVSFKFNDAQRLINDKLEQQLKETGKVRAIILKARQQGISTYCAARVFWKTYYMPHTRSVVMAHDGPTSEALFTMGKNIIQNMDAKIALSKGNSREIQFEHNSSGYRLYTAGSPEAGRGTTPTIAHLSEVAFWTHDEKILAGLFQGISQAAGTEVIVESTANGATGEFHRLFRGAMAGENEYIPVFIPWFLTPEYMREAPPAFELDLDEEKYKDDYDLNDDQMYWRRLKIAEGGALKFKQEYPANPEEAFLVSGSSVFDPEIVNKLLPSTPISTRVFNLQAGTFDEGREGSLELWQYPDWESNYIVSADVSLGVGQDYSTATVMDTERQVIAMYRNNRVDPSLFGDVLFYLGRYFNNALLAVESNSMGIATLNRLKQMNYVNLYYQTKAANMDNTEGDRPGFRTTSASKPMIIGYLKRAIEDEDIGLPSKHMISELKSYVSNENGSTGALPGCHDDTVIAVAIGLEVLRTHADKLAGNRVSWKQKNLHYVNDSNWL